MATLSKGSSVPFGIGSGSAKLIKIGGGTEGKVFLQDVRLSISSSSQEIMDGNGEVTGKIFFDKRKTLTATMFWTANGGTQTAEQGFVQDVEPGDELVLAYDEWLEVASDQANTLSGSPTPTSGTGKYCIDSIEKVRTSGGIAEFSVTAIEYVSDLT
jgi:hypothetical protein